MQSAGGYIFAAGGSGGHIYPAVAVAEALKQLQPTERVAFVATERQIDEEILGSSDWQVVKQPIAPLPRRLGEMPAFWRRWRASVRLCRGILRDSQVAAVLGSGGFAAGAMVKAATEASVPIGLLNPDAVPGRANRFCGKFADRIFLQWQVSAAGFGKFSEKCVVTGCPIRASLVGGSMARSAGRQLLGLDADKATLVVMGGSQGGHNVNAAVAGCLQKPSAGLECVRRDWQVLHLAGEQDCEWLRREYKAAGIKAEILAFTERMDAVLAAADLVIARAGASSLAELAAAGVGSILLPYPYHKDQHQLRNAEVPAAAGAAEIVIDQRDAKRTAGNLQKVLEDCLGQRGKLARMAEAAGRLAQPEAAKRVAREMIELAEAVKKRRSRQRRG